MLEAMERGMTGDVVLDVWENEPNVDERLLNKVYIGTPHIAGYSAEGKMNATRQVLEAARLFNITLADHVIFADMGYYSYADEGKL